MSTMQDNRIFIVRSGKGAINLGQKCTISLRISNDFGFVQNAKIVMYKQGCGTPKEFDMSYERTKGNLSFFNATVVFDEIGVYYYAISLNLNGNNVWIKKNSENCLPCITTEDFPFWRITACEKEFKVPDWEKGGIIYHIFVDRFGRDYSVPIVKNVPPIVDRTLHENWDELPIWMPDENGEVKNNDFFAGNLRGIQKRLKYLKSLGVTIIYLSPVCESQSNHRYDTGDYENVDPYAGLNEDLKNLCDAAHKMGMKVILDTVFNHTGNYSRYFNADGRYVDSIGASQGTDSPYYNWYKKWQGMFSYWWDFKNLPVIEPKNKEWQHFLFSEDGVIDKWFKLGIDGLRLDVADELPDFFLKKIRETVLRNKKDSFIIGEVWENAATKEKDGNTRNYLLGHSLDTVMNYPWTDAILRYVRFGDFKKFEIQVLEILNDYPQDAVFSTMNALSTHDITRAITTLQGEGIEQNREWVWDVPILGDARKNRQWQYDNDKLERKDYKEAKKKLKIATIIQYFLPGNVSIFYGDEVGLHGYKDPFNRKPYPWNHRDKDLLKFFRALGKIRTKYEFLREADFGFISLNEEILAFERTSSENSMYVVVNRGKNTHKIEMPEVRHRGKIIFGINYNAGVIGPYGAIIVLAK